MKRRVLSALGVWLALLVGLTWFDIANPPPPAHQPNQTNSYPTYQETQAQSANHDEQSNFFWHLLRAFWDWVTHDAVAFFTFALFVATAVLSTVAIVQIAFLIRADRAAGKSADAAKIAADAAKDSAETARRTRVETDRAWLALRAYLDKPLIFGTRFIEGTIVVAFKNVGKAPATQISLHGALYPSLVDALARKDAWDKTAQALRGQNVGVVMFPNEESSREVPFKMPISIFVAGAALVAEEAKKVGGDAKQLQRLTFVAGIYYQLPSDIERRRTVIIWQISHKDRKFPGFDGNPATFEAIDLELVQDLIGGEAN
jgi:hypothetical protein